MEKENIIYCEDSLKWHSWLEANHKSSKLVLLLFYKKHTKKPCITYEEAVEEALCYGWIDSIRKRVDDDSYTYKFTPRKAGSKWSELNVTRFKKIEAEGRVTQAGYDRRPQGEAIIPPMKRFTTFDEDIFQMLSENRKAFENFNNLPPSERRIYTAWIMSAKKEETRIKRMKEAISLLVENKKLGLK